MLCTIHFWMILSMPVNHPKEDVLYNPLLDDYTSSRIGCFVLYNPLLDDYVCVKL